MASPANPRLQPQNLTLLACHSEPSEDFYSLLIQQHPVKTRNPVLNAHNTYFANLSTIFVVITFLIDDRLY
jgi:hypothetical protein